MTRKKEQILVKAMELFANKGYHGVSTKKIAQAANVSEGLIFKHFQNKEGLLNAIIKHGKERAFLYFEDVQMIQDPKEQLKFIIQIPYKVKQKDYPFWRLIYALKWQAEKYDNSLSKPMHDMLTYIFKSLSYKNPAHEAELLLSILDGIIMGLLLKGKKKDDAFLRTIYSKYHLS